MQKFWLSVLTWILILQTSIGSTALTLNRAMAAGNGPGSDSAQSESAQDDGAPSGDSSDVNEQLTRDGQNDPLTVEGRVAAETFAAEYEAAGESEFPRSQDDAFHLTGQTFTVVSGSSRGTYDLSSLRVDLPSIVADFDKEIAVEVDRASKSVSLVFSKKGQAIARHTLSGFDVVAFARDKEMLELVDSSGRLFVIDMIYARAGVFRAPLPVFEVGSLPDGALSKGQLEATFVTRGMEPPAVVPADAVVPRDLENGGIWSAGDLAVTFVNAEGRRELVGVYNRGVSQMQMYTGESVVAFLATMVAPPDADAQARAVGAPLADPMVATRADQAAGNLDALTREALAAIPPQAIDKLRARAIGNKVRAASSRDRLEYEEWVKGFESLRARAKAEADAAWAKSEMAKVNGRADQAAEARQKELEDMIARGDLGREWQAAAHSSVAGEVKARSFLYRAMTGQAMKALAVIGTGVLAVKGVGALAGLHVDAGTVAPLAWSVHAANWLYAHVWPSVLKDAAYRVTLLKSFFTLTAFIPALQVVGAVYGRAKGWTSQKAKAVLGIRAYAAIQLPFWVRLARIVRQPNLMPSLRLGLNPFMKVTADSAIGRQVGLKEDVHPGLIAGGQNREEELALKRKVLEAIAVQKQRLGGYSFLLANIVVGERYGIDPATMLMARGGQMATPEAAALLNNPEFARQWVQVAREITLQLRDLRDGAVLADLSQLSADELLDDYRAAKAKAEEIASRGKLKATTERLKMYWRELGARFAKGVGGYGIEENDFLMNVDPSDAVVRATWQQFATDYLLSVYQMGLVGSRASLADPANLAANEHGIFWTNKGHFADNVDQAIRAYGLQNPADLALVFQKEAAPTEDRYDPIEKITMQGTPRMDTFVNGMLAWTKGVLSLRTANYGAVYMKSLRKKFKTLQASFTLSMAARLGLAGQSVAQALTGYGFLFFIGMPGYGWPWMPITQGNETYVESVAQEDAAFLKAKSKIAQGLRLNDSSLVNDGYNELSGIYAKHNGEDLPRNLKTGLAAAELMLSIPEEERLSELAKVENFYGQAARLRQAIDSGDEAAVARAYDEVRGQYGAEVSEQMKALNARSLLEVSLKNPPFRNKAHPMISWVWTTIGSIGTTFLATALFATSYGGSLTAKVFAAAIALSVKFYAGTYLGQKLINLIGSRLDYIRAREAQARAAEKGEAPAAKPGVPATYEEYRARYVEAKAAEFKVDPENVEAELDPALESALKARYEAEVRRAGCEQLLVSAEAVKPLTFGDKLRVLFGGVPAPAHP